MRLKTPSLLALVTLSAATHADIPEEWAFQLQCRSSLDPNTPAFNLPIGSSLSSQSVALDESGGVAIRVFLGIPNATEGVFHGQNGVGGLIHTVNDLDPVYSSGLALRNGRVALSFLLSPSQNAEIRDTSGSLLQSFPVGGTEGVSGASSISLTADGAIGYRGDFGAADKNLFDEYIGGIRTQTQIANTYDGNYSFLFSPRVNDARQMAGKVYPQAGGQAVIRWESDGTPTTIVSTAATYNAFVNSTAIAQNGLVAYSGRRSADSIWQIAYSDATTETVVAQGGQMGINNSSIANFPPVVNSDGWVALRPSDAVSTALYVGDGSTLLKLVEYGQLIDTDLGPLALGFDFGGGTGKQVMNGNIAINDAGQIAFAAFLTNGTIGVFVATPQPTDCIADFAPDGTLDFFDILAFLEAFTNADPSANINGDGTFDFFDVLAFLEAFAQGCP